MDAWLDLLAITHVHATLHARVTARGPWSRPAEAGGVAVFYVVEAGQALLRVADREEALAPGDVVVLPTGAAHQLGVGPAVALGLPRPPGGGPLPQARVDGDGPELKLLAGSLALGAELRARVAPLLPPALVARADGPTSAWLRATSALLSADVDGGGAGGPLLDRTADVFFVEALRAHFSRGDEHPAGWLAAFAEPVLARATHALHRDPAHPWTAAALAAAAGVSRTVLFSRFLDVLGEPPGDYLVRWRMMVARDALRYGSRPVAAVASSVGYRSEAAFNRAFRREFNDTPAAWRRGLDPAERHPPGWSPR